jgi:hypothetical protein
MGIFRFEANRIATTFYVSFRRWHQYWQEYWENGIVEGWDSFEPLNFIAHYSNIPLFHHSGLGLKNRCKNLTNKNIARYQKGRGHGFRSDQRTTVYPKSRA